MKLNIILITIIIILLSFNIYQYNTHNDIINKYNTIRSNYDYRDGSFISCMETTGIWKHEYFEFLDNNESPTWWKGYNNTRNIIINSPNYNDK